MRTCVLVVGHGSRDERASAEFRALVAAYRARRSDLRVEVAYIELEEPLVGEALAHVAAGVDRVVLLPMFLFTAGHVKNDLPLAVAEARRTHPAVTFAIAPALGVHPVLAELAYRRASAVLAEAPEDRAKTLLLVVGRGASDPDANGDFCKMARLIGEGRGLLHVEPSFMGITGPRVEASLELVARLRPERLVVLPYLLFAGRLVSKLAALVEEFGARHPWIRTALAPHLTFDEELLSLLDERVQQAADGKQLSPCDGCQYRTALPGLAEQVGGLRALLYSVRHTLTHAQAAMPIHVHKPLRKHVLVCVNADCADRGGLSVLEGVRREIKRAGRQREMKVTRTACMGRCGEGPTVAVYPDGVWYRAVKSEDAAEIVREHLIGDRLVSRLVGDILH